MRGRDAAPAFIFYLSILYLLYLAQPLAWLYQARLAPPATAVMLTALAAFVADYVWLMRRVLLGGETTRPTLRLRALGLAIMVGLAIALALVGGVDWLGLFIFASVATGFSVPAWPAVATIGAISAVTLATGAAVHGEWAFVGQIGGLDVAIGVGMLGTARLISVNHELRQARRELARLAVAEERLRIARDLHDLLGHSLSLIAVKSELAGRLLAAGQPRASVEVGHFEDVARAALQQVRDAVGGFRQPTLVSELESAQQLLAASGIDVQVESDWPTMPTASEAVLSWALREGVTNIIRHSGGRHCTIRIVESAEAVSLELTDDGRGSRQDTPTAAGAGLAGISERVAAIGGSWTAGAAAGGGFRLQVTVPRRQSTELSAP